IRYEGIDALETHFQGAHQDLKYANGAREKNLEWLGFTNVSFFTDLPNVIQSVDQNPLPGYVIANGIEAMVGCWVWCSLERLSGTTVSECLLTTRFSIKASTRVLSRQASPTWNHTTLCQSPW